MIGASSAERAHRPARHASQCLKDAAPDYLRFFELSGFWYTMFGIVAPQHTMQKVSYFVMLAGLYRKPSPLTCAQRAVPGDGGGEPALTPSADGEHGARHGHVAHPVHLLGHGRAAKAARLVNFICLDLGHV